MIKTPELYSIEWLEIEFLKRFMPQILDISSYHPLPPAEPVLKCPECGEPGIAPIVDNKICKNNHQWNPEEEGKKVTWFRDHFGPDGPDLENPPEKHEKSTGLWGLSIEMHSEEIIRLEFWMRKIDWAAYNLAAQFNRLRINEIMAEKETIRHEADWPEEAVANYVSAILDMQLKMQETNGYFANPNVAMCDPEVFHRFYDYLLTVDMDDNLFKDGKIEIYDISLRKMAASAMLPKNTIIMYDNKNGRYPTTVWHRTDPEFTRTGLVHFEEVKTDEGNRGFKIWIDCAVFCRDPPDIGILTLPAP